MNFDICKHTVMDKTDPDIIFDSKGISNHYYDFTNNILPMWNSLKNESLLSFEIDKIKKENKNKEFDCILGLSGGLDSSYMLHILVNKFNLRPLVFHVDAGWNTDVAVHNIKTMLDKLNLDLMTVVINWDDMREFQLAWFRSGVPHLDIPQDHAFVSTLYKFCNKYGISTVVNGGNIATECVQRPLKYIYWGSDMRHIKYIVRKYCNSKLKNYPFNSAFSNKFVMPYIKGIKIFKPLNHINYNKNDAISELEKEYGWRSYDEKHYESRFTKFFEGYWLYNRFGFDMRKVDYSSLILTGQLSRADALKKLSNSPYPATDAATDFKYIASKLGISEDELNHYFLMDKKFYYDYPNHKKLLNLGEKILSTLRITRRGGAF